MTLIHVCLDWCQWSLMSLITGNIVKKHTSQGINLKIVNFYKPWSNMKILMLFHDFDVIDLLFHDLDVLDLLFHDFDVEINFLRENKGDNRYILSHYLKYLNK
jgi:hypothetical protein